MTSHERKRLQRILEGKERSLRKLVVRLSDLDRKHDELIYEIRRLYARLNADEANWIGVEPQREAAGGLG